MNKNIPYSFLDLAVIGAEKSTKETLNNVLVSAQHAEQLNYTRFWLAEHHNMPHIASSATSVLIGYVAGGTEKIRVGSGGIMLPNHPPLVIAEQFGTLESLYPNRIDLGLGRAQGTDQLTAMALRRNDIQSANFFPQQIQELKTFFSETNAEAKVRAFPGEGLDIPFWILGSSTESAYLAAELGLPYAFASHFAPDQIQMAGKIYRNNFKPSAQLEQPYFMPCVNVILADSAYEAEKLATSFYRMFLGIIRNDRKPLQPPIESMQGIWTVQEEAAVYNMTACSFIGTKEEMLPELNRFCEVLEVDELMITTPIYDYEQRKYSMKLFAEVMQDLEQS
ncbi:LLM class flavin-dependent oxidoreductase [Myroides sp. 1354]|uniref:LLM class flavin-dependent oxidoreductase n=1 Tax=unclassified Myroides TaxID=2642485 RepID=UPI002574C6CF|nr:MULTISPECIES: LLM class flavin-dependent oxidoreductase [unclassified Myroides]MDM1043784.1 LLM class flavin-dependent oxidoreductase [Myroides sp. R163-1]MDM1054719.1 LLM class flavin-dependent oxidoreductase [Myroides sp. 1354]MDM1068016.1 LLM class flavin-dependent oxidoreductase [Myroides sp. 1372]